MTTVKREHKAGLELAHEKTGFSIPVLAELIAQASAAPEQAGNDMRLENCIIDVHGAVQTANGIEHENFTIKEVDGRAIVNLNGLFITERNRHRGRAAPEHHLFEMVKDLAEEAHGNGNSWGEWAKPRMDAILSALMCVAPEQEQASLPATIPNNPNWTTECGNFPVHDFDYDAGYAQGRNDCIEEIARLGPLYTHADPSNLERLRAELATERLRADAAVGDANEAEQKLAEAQALLRNPSQRMLRAGARAVMRTYTSSANARFSTDDLRTASAAFSAMAGDLLSATAQPAEVKS